MPNKADEFKAKYAEGYRCICEEADGENVTLHLKNFEKEKIHTISTNVNMEIGEIADFLDSVDLEKKLNGDDTICTQNESNLGWPNL
ncbi:MAG: hypothetical protein ATN34_00240 [Epulopiscium sp. Nele67-Bin002]|nr:MAG: hypothetical protein ATN34_00240 [Epulopiscium sp. Nele67-Bin002]OON94896.1 MAG: hypothetical protein ATN33_03785 [Epulopiscium sp. Nele67-Bin001]